MLDKLASGRGLLVIGGLLLALLIGSGSGLGGGTFLLLFLVAGLVGFFRWRSYQDRSAADHRRFQAEMTAMLARAKREAADRDPDLS